MLPKLIDIIGLFFSLFGVIIFAYGLIIPRKRALDVGVSRISEDSDEENLNLPHVQDRIRESRHALAGLVLLSFGFFLQIIGTWVMP